MKYSREMLDKKTTTNWLNTIDSSEEEPEESTYVELSFNNY
jgi:hypothetical protein